MDFFTTWRLSSPAARVFLFGDAVSCAMAGQKTPNGFYNLERMLRAVAAQDALIGCCGSCLDARGMCDSQLVQGTRRSDMDELADWTLWADKVIAF